MLNESTPNLIPPNRGSKRSSEDQATSTSDGTGGASTGRNCKKYRKLVPQPDSEAPVVCKLVNSSTTCVELCGWSFMAPTRFFNSNLITRPLPMTDGRGEMVQKAAQLKTKAITLLEMLQMVGNPTEVKCPVLVHVVAKRKVDLFSSNKKLLIISQVVVADHSGYCTLTSLNEGLVTIISNLEVGDELLLSGCRPQNCLRPYHRGLFANEMFLNLELKLSYSSARNHFIRKFSAVHPAQSQMPLQLFENNCELKSPSDLEAQFQQTSSHAKVSPNDEQYYDLIGVVVYTGRIERFKAGDSHSVECIVAGSTSTTIKQVPRFIVYRWVYLVDETSSVTFPVKIYVTNGNSPQQASLVPGAILVMTHCQTTECAYFGKFTRTSPFSQLYLDAITIEKYFRLRPPTFRDKAQNISNRENYIKIISRTEVELSAGGTHAMKICHKETLLSTNTDRHSLHISHDRRFGRRESVRHYFEGMILRVIEVHDENAPRVRYKHNQKYVVQMLRKEDGEFKLVENFLPFVAHKNSSWYAFQRKLPPFDRSILEESKCRDVVKRMMTYTKAYCEPLLMPAEISNYNENGPPPSIADLERLDGPPYLLIDIVNEEKSMWYTCIWKSRQFAAEEKLHRIEAAKDKKVICIAEIFCTEPTAPLEVNLLDFVTVEDEEL